MYYLGIDIGKKNHEAGVIDQQGNSVGKTLRFSNSKTGSDKLLAFLNQHQLTPDNCACGLEATGHYWLSVFTYLYQLGFKVTAFNPLQSDALRNFYIRKTKTDTRDAFLIAQVIRIDVPEATPFIEEALLQIRHLERLRYSLVDQSSDIKRKVIALLDQIFPEYEELFSEVFGTSSSELLFHYPMPEDIQTIDTDSLAAFLNESSKQSYGEKRAHEKATKIKQSAAESFGITMANDSFRMQIHLLLEQLSLLDRQIHQIEEKLSALVKQQATYLTTIKGVGDVTAAVIIGEIGSIERFYRPEQLVAFAGLDPAVKQSGKFNATEVHISKRGSPYLRRAIWHAAFSASQSDPALSQFYNKLKDRGKGHHVAVGAVARKLAHIIFAILRDNKPYEPQVK
ncbi:IS110 family transposase [Saliterribacillus persicus]|uniref:Transposase n=1 Tax=Saliterribacillus persicus TaxID=930114 RepID=A0A368YBL4_9BACI|nr:IS110 family transposase [Saliterribacillus persicus]RCW77515.1 transposase [Saliterribacillus persicus]